MSQKRRIIDIVPDGTIIGSLILAYFVSRTFPVSVIIPTSLRLLGWLLVAAGLVSAIYIITLIRRNNGSSKVTAAPPSLMTHGVYSFSRNPFYLSYIVITLGAAIALGTVGAFVGPVVCIIVLTLVARFEENRLKRELGNRYAQYKRSVGRWV